MFSGGRRDSREEDESKREETGNGLAWERDPPKKVVDASTYRPELSLRPYPLYIHMLLTTPASNRVAASDHGPERTCRRSRTWVSPRCAAILKPGREVDMHERHMLPMVRRKTGRIRQSILQSRRCCDLLWLKGTDGCNSCQRLANCLVTGKISCGIGIEDFDFHPVQPILDQGPAEWDLFRAPGAVISSPVLLGTSWQSSARKSPLATSTPVLQVRAVQPPWFVQ